MTSASAQLPFYTDDADTTEEGQFHLEFYNEHDVLQKSAYPGKRQNTAVFTLNYGLTDSLELGINAPLITIFNARGVGNPTGVGDAQLGVKYRLRDERENSRMPAVTAVFYVETPTGDVSRQLGSGLFDYWLYGVAQKTIGRRAVARLNGGILFTGNSSTGLVGVTSNKGQVYTANGSLTRDFSDRLRLGAEVFGAVASTPSLNRGSLVTHIGGNYAVTENFSLAFGVLGGGFSASPRVGAIFGFSYDFK